MSEPTRPLLTRARPIWYLLAAITLIAIVLGVYAYSIQYRRGYIVTGLRNPMAGGAAWGFYIAFDVYFVGVSFAGITVASIARLFHIETLKPVTRMAELLTICALLCGAMMVMADLGRPGHGLLLLPMLARPSSPFYGTFTLVVSGYLFSSLVFFFLAGRSDAAEMARIGPRIFRPLYRLWASGHQHDEAAYLRHKRVSFVLALTIIPLLVTAHSTLGFIFGIQAGRPGWYSSLQAPGFVIMAGVSGTGVLIMFAVVARKVFRLEDRLPAAAIGWLGNLLWVLSLVYLYFMIVEELTASYAGPRADRHVAHDIVTGSFARSFWAVVICLFLTFLIPFVMYLARRTSLAWLAVAGFTANIAAVIKRLLIVVPSQTRGGMMSLKEGIYVPTWIELAIVVGALSCMTLMMLTFGRVFPLVPTPHAMPPGAPPKERLRTLATAASAACAVTLIAIGLSDSFRLWSGSELDPRIPFSPAIFAGGVILLFSSAVVYETFPTRRRMPPARVQRVFARERQRTALDRAHRARRQP